MDCGRAQIPGRATPWFARQSGSWPGAACCRPPLASDEATLRRARQVAPGLQIGNLSTQPAGTYLDRSHQIECRILQPSNGMANRDLAADQPRLGMEVNPFCADDKSEVGRFVDCGAEGVLTNYPERLHEFCQRPGAG